MSFNIRGGTTDIYSCTECNWLQVKKHFISSGDGPLCTLCRSPAEKIDETQPITGMSDFKYRELLAALEESADGVGAATVANIEQHFEEGDDFLDAAEAAYQKLETDELESVDGVGRASAKSIALTIAEEEGWEDGAIFQMPTG